MNIAELIKDMINGDKEYFRLGRRDVYDSIKELFPLRISVAPEFKHTLDENRKSLHIVPKSWHYDEILDQMKDKINIEYIPEDNSFLFYK